MVTFCSSRGILVQAESSKVLGSGPSRHGTINPDCPLYFQSSPVAR